MMQERKLPLPHLYVKRMRNGRVLIRSRGARGKVGNALCSFRGYSRCAGSVFHFSMGGFFASFFLSISFRNDLWQIREVSWFEDVSTRRWREWTQLPHRSTHAVCSSFWRRRSFPPTCFTRRPNSHPGPTLEPVSEARTVR